MPIGGFGLSIVLEHWPDRQRTPEGWSGGLSSIDGASDSETIPVITTTATRVCLPEPDGCHHSGGNGESVRNRRAAPWRPP